MSGLMVNQVGPATSVIDAATEGESITDEDDGRWSLRLQSDCLLPVSYRLSISQAEAATCNLCRKFGSVGPGLVCGSTLAL